ncbi:MAG: peptide chain release factor N(5)-glutamine methyltransferase [Candidatus Zapsychrus exili]|nr:peptide chain release factor N(5)-glutamine methyltransferase [Candidatus Zapsychrus exili]
MKEQELMLTSILDCRRVDLFTKKVNLSPFQKSKFTKMKERRAKDEPLQYIIGFADFLDIKLFVDKRVLVPRPETEILVDLILGDSHCDSHLKILDLGTGSGNIAIALAKNIKDCHVTSIDVSIDAIELAKYNAKYNEVGGKIDFICEDLTRTLIDKVNRRAEFDIIVSNPPYVPTADLENLPEDVKQEPMLALDGGEDGLDFYHEIIPAAAALLSDKGFLALEIGDGQAEAIKEIAEQEFLSCEFTKDYVGTERVAVLRKKAKGKVR